VFAEAKEAGVRRMVLNHPNFVIEATTDRAEQIADFGALVEHSICMDDDEREVRMLVADNPVRLLGLDD